jgi:exonuclease SbcD
MRFLHTGDWHLGRTIRGRSRIDECARVLDEVIRMARDEGVDAVLIAGDTFDTFAQPAEAQKLLYETLMRLVRDGVRVVMIAGNHDSAARMDALSGILELAGVHSVGSLPADDVYRAIRVPSRDGDEAATVVAVPWIPERLAVRYETLFGESNAAYQQYAANMERALRFYCRQFQPDTVNVLLAHMFVSGTVVGEGSGERRLQIGDIYAVPGQLLPATAQYIALGHVHRPQPVPDAPVAGAAFYAGSLLQLDFGEAEQEKSVRIVDARPGLPADSKAVRITRGTSLRNLRLRIDELAAHAGKYGDEYVRVFVEVDAPVQQLAEQVLAALPNAVSIEEIRTGGAQPPPGSGPRPSGLEPHELLSRYYLETRAQPIPAELTALFNEMYEEALAASA